MYAIPPPSPVPHPAAIRARRMREEAAKAADVPRQDAIRELAEVLGIPPAEVIPGAYAEPIPPPPGGRASRPPYISPSGLVVPHKPPPLSSADED